MPATSPNGYPYPLPTDTPDVPRDIKALTDFLDTNVPPHPAHKAYTPGQSGITLGTPGQTLSGTYWQHGDLVHADGNLVLGTGGSFTGTISVGVPVAALASEVNCTVGVAHVVQGAARQIAVAYLSSATALTFIIPGGTLIGAGVPAAWAATHTLRWSVTYAAAVPL
jgi:hypothetical protein